MRQVALLIAGLGAFLYGVAVGHYQLFPFDQIQEGISWVKTGKSSPRFLARRQISSSGRDQIDIVLLGDSITAAGDWARLLPNVSIANHGIGGDFVADVRNRLMLTINQKPKLVLLMIGVNDVMRGSPYPAMLQGYHEIISALDEANIKVVAQSILLTSKVEVNFRIRSINGDIASICFEISRCQYVDLNAAIAPRGVLEMTDDGVHLTAPAYDVWARVIDPLVSQYR